MREGNDRALELYRRNRYEVLDSRVPVDVPDILLLCLSLVTRMCGASVGGASKAEAHDGTTCRHTRTATRQAPAELASLLLIGRLVKQWESSVPCSCGSEV